MNSLIAQSADAFRTIRLLLVLILVIGAGEVFGQDSTSQPIETLTLDQAIALALHDNRGIKIARLAVEKSDDQVSAAKTFRLPSLHAYSLFSGNLATNELKIPNLTNTLYPGFGPFFSLNAERKPTALMGASVIEPISQQYRIGLQIKLERLSRDVAQAKLRQEQNETIDKVKKAYYAVLQTQSGLTSVQEALKSYRELDKITGDYVVQQVAIKADHLTVQTRLARVQRSEEHTSELQSRFGI